MKKSNLAMVAISEFRGEKASADKNGLNPVFLNPVAGVIPNRNILSGTVARDRGFIVGKTYMVKFTRTEDREDEETGNMYPNVDFVNLGTPTMLDIAQFEESAGPGDLQNVFNFPITARRITPVAGSEDDNASEGTSTANKATSKTSKASAQQG